MSNDVNSDSKTNSESEWDGWITNCDRQLESLETRRKELEKCKKTFAQFRDKGEPFGVMAQAERQTSGSCHSV